MSIQRMRPRHRPSGGPNTEHPFTKPGRLVRYAERVRHYLVKEMFLHLGLPRHALSVTKSPKLADMRAAAAASPPFSVSRRTCCQNLRRAWGLSIGDREQTPPAVEMWPLRATCSEAGMRGDRWHSRWRCTVRARLCAEIGDAARLAASAYAETNPIASGSPSMLRCAHTRR